MKKNICNYFFVIFLAHHSNSFCQALDPTFGTGGKVITDFNMNSNDRLNAMALQSDGKIVVAGSCGMGFALMRYDNGGALDLTFGAGGKVLSNYGYYPDIPYAVAIQNDGKILVAGRTYSDPYNQDILVTRYNINGTTDLLFGTNGAVILDLAGGTDIAHSVVLQPDGKILIGGKSGNTQQHFDFLLLRLNTDGSGDANFGNIGIATLSAGNQDYYSHTIALQNDGKIIIAGGKTGFAPNSADFALARFNNNGSPDSTFGTNGIAITDFAGKEDIISSAVLQPDGKIIAAGWVYTNSGADFAFARYNTDGSGDQTFGCQGRGTLAISTTWNFACSAALQNDGKILLAGWSNTSPPCPCDANFALIRLNSDGSPDSTFDNDGIVLTDFRNSSDGAKAIAIQPDGKIVVGGMSSNPLSYNQAEGDFALARYESNISGIQTDEQPNKLLLYPNPTTGILTVSYSSATTDAITIRVFTCFGQFINSETSSNFIGKHSKNIDLSKQSPGIYFIEVIDRDKRTVRKIVLE